MAISFLAKRKYASVTTRGRTRMIELTAKGERERTRCEQLLSDTERDLSKRCGATHLNRLRRALTAIAAPGETPLPLLAGLNPYPDNWRAKAPRVEHLPDYPVPLHRGGYPDGS